MLLQSPLSSLPFFVFFALKTLSTFLLSLFSPVGCGETHRGLYRSVRLPFGPSTRVVHPLALLVRCIDRCIFVFFGEHPRNHGV